MSETLIDLSSTEMIGYFGSLAVLLSFLMKSMKHLRIASIIGCSIFILYGFLLHYSIPIIFTNVSIVIINVYYLIKNKPAE